MARFANSGLRWGAAGREKGEGPERAAEEELGCPEEWAIDDGGSTALASSSAVSYTHLTLPTICSV
eukprot:8883126-Alexandrium_andersonii.AAC.1